MISKCGIASFISSALVLVFATAPRTTFADNKDTPKHPDAQTLLQSWKPYSRADGSIPGGLIARLHTETKYFIKLNEGSDLANKMTKLLPRFDSQNDWNVNKTVALMDAITDVHSIPIDNCQQRFNELAISGGEPLPEELVDASWGKPAENGLRVAWFTEPTSKWHRLGTPLKSRVLVHNSGEQSVFFLMPNWQQSFGHKAKDSDGTPIEAKSTYWTTRATMKMCRLAPGEYVETPAAGIGVGDKTDREDWGNFRPGTWIKASAGDKVTLTPGTVEVRYSASVNGTRMIDGRAENTDPKTGADLWKQVVSERVERVLPFPESKAEQERVLKILTAELLGKPAEQRDVKEFLDDDSKVAGDLRLKEWLLKDRSLSPFTGVLQPGEISFRVLPADPEVDKKPRVATGPGYYDVAGKVRLQIQRSPDGKRRINRANLRFFSGSSKITPPDPVQIELPDGMMTYAIAWERNAKVIWVVETTQARSYDFTDPDDVQIKTFKRDDSNGLPKRLSDAISETFKMLGAELKAS